jgi:tetratricopeptide (TPR) repeat protein
MERFLREAQVLANLSHPGIVRYVTHGRTQTGELYLAMEWLDGESLSQRLARQGLLVEETLTLGLRVAEALSAAHKRGIVHRDIKPNNLFLVGNDVAQPKILDFGVARLRSSQRELTQTGAMIGTPGYMSPEQARGEREVDPRADVFALGCVLFKCLTGRPAFVGDDVLAVLLKVVLEDAPRVSELRDDVPAALDELVSRMLAKALAARPADAAAVAEQIHALGSLTGAAAPRGQAAVALTASERRLMCVVLARPPEGSARTDALEAAIVQHGGKLERFPDHTVFVNVSGSGAATDHAARAARCTLAMRAAVPEAPVVLAAGRGVLTGRVPVGEVIDRAVALLAHARPGEIRLDHVVAGLLDVRFDVRGDASGLTLQGERDVAEARRTLLGKPTTCVGRDRELVTLEAIWGECTGEPVSRAVLVSAAAGVGKSRLRYEFLRKIEDKGTAFEIWIGRGDPMSAGSPFGMIATPIRRAAGLRSGEPLAVRQQKLRARVGRYLPGREADRVAEFVGEMVGVPFPDDDSVQLRAARQDAMLMGDQMRRAWEDWLRAETGQQPLLMVLEDLHWGDLPSVKFVDAALRNLGDRPLMVVALARPEVHELFPRLWADRELQEIRLAQLTKKGSERLVRQVLGDTVSERTVTRLVDRSAGNAFYLEELIRAVAEGKGEELPATVLAMVQARIESLEGEARRVLRAASVFGQVFWRGGVLALLGGEETALTMRHREWLSELADRELISARTDSKFPGEPEYIFRNALIREGAYGMLTEGDRTLGHRLAAEWLLNKDEEDAAVLGEHFERGGEASRALVFYQRAAEHALGGNDFAAAVKWAERGVVCGAGGAELGGLRLLQTEAHNWSGEHIKALATGSEAMRHLPRGSELWCKAAGDLGVASGRLEKAELLEPLAEDLLSLPGLRSGPLAIAAVRTANPLLFAGRTELAERLFALAEACAPTPVDNVTAARPSQGADPEVLARLHEARGTRALLLGDPAAYIRSANAAASCFEQAGDMRGACLLRVNAGCVSMEIGFFAEAEAALRDALAAAERMGLHTVAAAARNNLGLALARQGALEEARAIERGAIAAAVSQGFRRLEAGSRMYLATILMLSGDLESAEREGTAAVEMMTGAPPMRAQALAILAQVRLAANTPPTALAAAREAMDLLESQGGMEEGESTVRLVYAEALHATGDVGGARAAIAAARERLLERAAKISDPERRQGFLERVPDNARTLGLALKWGPVA